MLRDWVKITYNLDEVADSLEEGIEFLNTHNIDSAEVRTINGKNIAKLSIEETHALKKTLNDHGLTVSAIASPLFKWYSGDVKRESSADLFGMNPLLSIEEKKEMINKIISQAKILETNRIRIFSGLKPDDGHHSLPDEESKLILYALKLAGENDVQLMLENEPVCHISKLEDYINAFTSGEYTGLKAWFDIANVYQEGEQLTARDLTAIVPFIEYMHIKDPIGLKAHKYTVLGQGYINYKRIFDNLERVIKKPIHISIETHVKNDKRNASHKSLEYLKTLLYTKRIKYAVVGTGRISKKHFTALESNDNSTLMGVYDTNPEKAATAAMEQDCINYQSLNNLLSDEMVDVVSICTPHSSHIELAKQALLHEKKVLCEKPLAMSSEELAHYVSEIDKNQNTHVVLQNRFNQAVKRLYDFEKTELGDPKYIAMALRWWRDTDYYKDWHGSKALSGGMLITQAIHSLELVTHLSKGCGIKKVTATQLKTRQEITLPDIVLATVEFNNGLVCTIEACVATKYGNLESSFFVIGTKGSVKVGGVALSDFVFPSEKNDEAPTYSKDYYGNGHTSLYRTLSNYYLDNYDEDVNLLARPEDIIPTIKLIEAIENNLLESK